MYGQIPSYGVYGQPDQAVCNVWPVDDGWRVQVVLPRRLSNEQRVEILDWLFAYKAEVRQQHPYWFTLFSDNGHEFILDVVQADGPRQALRKLLPFIQSRQPVGTDYRERGDAAKRQVYVGGLLAALGFVSVTVLACLGQREVAMMLIVFLATVIGATIGGKSARYPRRRKVAARHKANQRTRQAD